VSQQTLPSRAAHIVFDLTHQVVNLDRHARTVSRLIE
jgi:hypothetical protein